MQPRQTNPGFLKTNFSDLGNEIKDLWKPVTDSNNNYFYILSAVPTAIPVYLFEKAGILTANVKGDSDTLIIADVHEDQFEVQTQTTNTTQTSKKVSAKKIAFFALGCLTFIPALAISIAIAAICAVLTAVYAVFQTLNIVRVNLINLNNAAYKYIGSKRLKGHRVTLYALAAITLALVAMLVLSMPQLAILPLNPLSLAVAVGAMSILLGLSFFSTKQSEDSKRGIMNNSTKTLFLLLTIAAPLASYGMQLAGLTVAPWAAVLLAIAPALIVSLGVFGSNMYHYNSLAKAAEKRITGSVNSSEDNTQDPKRQQKPESNRFKSCLINTFRVNFASEIQDKVISSPSNGGEW